MSDPELLRRLADELAVRNLVARFAHLADMSGADDLDEYMDMFTDDASWEMPGNERHGKAAILAGARERRQAGQQGPGANSRHVITTLAVRVEGDEAIADSYFLAVRDTDSVPAIGMIGHYHDTFRRHGDGWKLARRRITFG